MNMLTCISFVVSAVEAVGMLLCVTHTAENQRLHTELCGSFERENAERKQQRGVLWCLSSAARLKYMLLGSLRRLITTDKLSRLRWAGHVIRQDDDDLSKTVLLSEPGGKRPRGLPRLRWEGGVKENEAKLECRNWTVVALIREG